MMRGWPLFILCCTLVAGLSVVPPEYARWAALSLLVLMVFTPAIGRYASADRRSGEAASPRGERGD